MSKLVRDRIPDIMKAEGIACEWHYARKEEYWRALVTKLKEEVDEFIENNNTAELVDIMEVVDAIKQVMDPEKVQEMRDEKAKRRGTFEKRIILDSP